MDSDAVQQAEPVAAVVLVAAAVLLLIVVGATAVLTLVAWIAGIARWVS